MIVHWFNNPHEHRNHWLKLGLMRLHQLGEIDLKVHALQESEKYGFSPKVAAHEHRHTVNLMLEEGSQKVKVLVDSEDSFIQTCPLITEVDVYFKAGYNTDFHKHQRFVKPYAWQTEENVRWYREESERIWEAYGHAFHKIRKFIPISPEMRVTGVEKSLLRQKAANMRHKLHKTFGSSLPWDEQYRLFEQRYDDLISLRDKPLTYDIVLHDSLWGWPAHRYRLHKRLQELADQYRIHSRLGWRQNEPKYGAMEDLREEDFPVETRPIEGSYEEMIAASRMGVFATGFHWGWRSIMALAFMAGIPVYMDRLLLEPHFDMKEFIWYENEGSFVDLQKHLDSISNVRWEEVKRNNQQVYDKYMSPENTANYFTNILDL